MSLRVYLGPYLHATATSEKGVRDACPNKAKCPFPAMTPEEAASAADLFCSGCGEKTGRRFQTYNFMPEVWEKMMDQGALMLWGRLWGDDNDPVLSGCWVVNLTGELGPCKRAFYLDDDGEFGFDPDQAEKETKWFQNKYAKEIARLSAAPGAKVKTKWGLILEHR